MTASSSAPLPVGRVRALPGGFDEARRGRGPRLALRLAARERLQVGRERGVGNRRRGDPVPQHRRGLGDQTSPRRRAARCAGPRRASRAPPTARAGAGRPRVTGVPGAGLRDEARRRGLVQRRQRLLQPRQRRHLRERAVHAEHGRGVDEVARGPRSSRTSGRCTTSRNERGDGQRPLPRRPTPRAGNSASSALACSGLPRVPSRRRRAATGDSGDPSWAARSRSSGSASPGSAMAAPVCPSTTLRRPSGSPVTASRTPIRTSTWSATSRRSANSSAERDGRSAQCASSTTTTTTPRRLPRRRGRAAAATACRR